MLQNFMKVAQNNKETLRKWRYEYKILINSVPLEDLKALVRLHPKFFIERYPVRRVNNIYFDTADLSNYHDSLSGCAKRSKLRFRWYGESFSKVKGSLELKEKNGVLISKESQAIDCKFDLEKLSWDEITVDIDKHLKGYIKNYFFNARTPVIINSYYRYYYETHDSSCRITIDYNQKSCDQRVYSTPNFHFRNPLTASLILEIKAGCDHKIELDKITNYFPFRISQNSKYTSGIFWI